MKPGTTIVIKRWANAVILENESITYKENEEIPEDNIESYLYGYQDINIRYGIWENMKH